MWTVGTDSPLRALDKCMGVSGGGSAEGTKASLYGCNGSAAQKCGPGADGTSRYPQSGKCHDAVGVSSADRIRLDLWTCGPVDLWTCGPAHRSQPENGSSPAE
ncbi:ricin-type beta-trefoil lectin domain protein [Streptomyces sp. NPDC050529]|uniref:ricin-type beta-trefoil lectin domain protein n=1 Tax=Streptomyces sp. NPDC050529 TaxID=3365624 RepID=UPI0037A3B4D5